MTLISRLLWALSSLAILSCLYLAYSHFAEPWIEPPLKRHPGADYQVASPVSIVERHPELAGMFSPDDWELGSPIVIETKYGLLLLRNYETDAQGRLLLRPCTLVLFSAESLQDISASRKKPSPQDAEDRPPRPVVMKAPDGAELEFDEPLDLKQGRIGQLLGGRMLGEIRIFSPESQPGAGDMLALSTRNVQIDDQRIWTPHDVKFRYGAHHGAGRDLTIALAPGSDASRRNRLSVGGVKSLEMVQVSYVRLQIEQGGLWPVKDIQDASVARSAKNGQPETIDIVCQGPFQFDVSQFMASFEDEVQVRRLQADGRHDTLHCQHLAVHFHAPERLRRLVHAAPRGYPAGGSVDFATSSLPSSSEGSGEKKPTVQRLVAVGAPVVLDAPSFAAAAQAERLECDLLKQRIRLESDSAEPPGAQSVPGRVRLKYKGFEITAPQVDYQWDRLGELGRIWAPGPGRLRGALPPPRGYLASRKTSQASRLLPAGERHTFELVWHRETRLRPHEGMYVASALGAARATLWGDRGEAAEVSADEVYVWLKSKSPRQDAATERAPVPASGSPVAPGKRRPRFEMPALAPDRLLALGVVRAHTPRLTGSAGRVEAWFVDVPPERLAAEDPSLSDNEPLEEVWGEKRQDENLASFDVAGNLIRLQIFRAGRKLQLDEATLEGDVRLAEVSPQKNELPFVLTGNYVRLQQVGAAGGAGAMVRILGHPAQASARGMTLRGTNLQLDRAASRVWIVGPGEMSLDTRHLRTLKTRPESDHKLPEEISVSWQDGLELLGEQARVMARGAVEGRGNHQRISARTLTVALSRPIDMQSSENFDDLQPTRLRFDGGVSMENRLWKQGRLVSIDTMQAPNLTINVPHRTLLAEGPGWVRTIRRGNADLASIGAGNSQPPVPTSGSPGRPATTSRHPAPRGRPAREDDSLIAAHIDYERAISGQALDEKLSRWTLTLADRVQAGYRPAAHWEDQLVSSKLADVGPRGLTLSCRQLSVAEVGEAIRDVRQIEAHAVGNTHIQSHQYEATADELSYALSKDLMILDGGRGDAVLRRFGNAGGGGTRAEAQKILFWRSLNQVEVDQGRYLGVESVGRATERRDSRLR